MSKELQKIIQRQADAVLKNRQEKKQPKEFVVVVPPQVMIDQAKYFIDKQRCYEPTDDQLERLRQKAIHAIKEYRESRNYKKKSDKDKEEITGWLKSIGQL